MNVYCMRSGISYKKVLNRTVKKFFKNKYIMTAIILSIILTLVSFLMITSPVSASSRAKNTKVITSVKIEKGDTLWSIAEDYMTAEYTDIVDYINEIKRTNGITSDIIFEGCYIIVPHYMSTNQ